ncbi:MAG: hypothetical protein WDM89_08765 [Rhizomicrobium sp.]
MTLTVAIQMDPIEKIDIGGDSTFALALEGAGARALIVLPRPARSDVSRWCCERCRAPAAGARDERRSLHARRSTAP